MAYTKRYGAGFNDLGIPGATPADSQYLNAVETSLLRLDAVDPTVDGQVMQWVNASSRFGPALLLNKNIDPAAAIDKSKLNLTGQIVNADISAAASIAKSKLAALSIVDADVSSISASKITGLSSPIVFRKVTTKAVNNTVTPTDLLNAEFTLGAAALSATGIMRLTCWGNWLTNTGGPQRFPKLQFVVGGTTVFDTGFGATANTTTLRAGWVLDVICNAQNATNAQAWSFRLHGTATGSLTSGQNSSFVVGNGANDWGIATSGNTGGYSIASNITALDMTTSKAVVLNVTNDVAGATYEMALLGAVAEVF